MGSRYEDMTLRERFDIIESQLKIERTTFEDHWQQLADFTNPTKVQFDTTEVNRGERVNEDIIDINPALSLRTLRSGMLSGKTPRSSPWFELGVQDPEF